MTEADNQGMIGRVGIEGLRQRGEVQKRRLTHTWYRDMLIVVLRRSYTAKSAYVIRDTQRSW